MGKTSPSSAERAFNVASGTLSAAGPSTTSFSPENSRGFAVSISGTWTGGVSPERSHDGGTTWVPVSYIDGSPIVWSGTLATFLEEPEPGTLWRLRAASGFAGSAAWRFGQ